MAAATSTESTPPYVSWSMFEATLERMRQESIPGRLDRSFLPTASGSGRAQLTGAMRSLGLIDSELRPTDALKELVLRPDDRQALLRKLLEAFYAPILALEDNATQDQLSEAFRNAYGIQGSTVVKAASFYLSAAAAAEIKLSPLFAKTRSGGSASGARRRRAPRPAAAAPVSTPSPAGELPDIVGALVAKLPKKGEPWSAEEFNWWIEMVKMAGPREYGFTPDDKGTR
ncbi:MAG: DUF5343 domain-containing protein [Actinobacteria bacterium]|nr:DUF5343 domain-containing protein [Actinomycetota bacterium]